MRINGINRLPRILVKKKTGYRNVTGGPVVLLDERGIPFYDTNEVDKKVWEFNLPHGLYYILSGKFREKPSPVEYPLPYLPPAERMKADNPENYDIKFTENPFTGSVFWDLKGIYLDNSLKDVSIPCLVFVLYHEYGHRYYSTEQLCDLYAKREMLREGYNPSQVNCGIDGTLSDNQLHRKFNIIKA